MLYLVFKKLRGKKQIGIDRYYWDLLRATPFSARCKKVLLENQSGIATLATKIPFSSVALYSDNRATF